MGLRIAEPGFRTGCMVEWDAGPRAALVAAQRAGYFDPAPIWDDVRSFDARPFAGAFDTVLGGYPCQPFSVAGKRRGEEDPRHLWPHFARIIGELGGAVRWVFLENVYGHLSMGAETVCRELRRLGFRVAAGIFSAREIGAPHVRKRWFAVAHREGDHGWRQQPQEGTRRGRCGPAGSGEGLAASRGDCLSGPAGGAVPDARGAGLQGREFGLPCAAWQGPSGPDAEQGGPWLFPPAPDDPGGWADALRLAPDLAPAVSGGDAARFAQGLAGLVAQGALAESRAQSLVRRLVDGVADRARALRMLGNGVVPLVAAHAWRSLALALGLRPVDLGA